MRAIDDHRMGCGARRRRSHERGGWSATWKPGFESRRGPWRRHGDFFGFSVEEMSPGARVMTALSVLVAVALSGLVLVAFVPGLWWVPTTYFWVAFPAFGLLARGVAGSAESPAGQLSASRNTGERELLEALRGHGELTPVLAAMETSLTVKGAEGILKELAEAGRLEVRARGGGLFYALWESTDRRGALEGERHGETISRGAIEEQEGARR